MKSFRAVLDELSEINNAKRALSDLIGMVGIDEIARAHEDGADANIRSFQSWNKTLAYGFLARNSHFVKQIVILEAGRFASGDIVGLFKMIDERIFDEDVETIERYMKTGICRRGYVSYLSSLITIEYIARLFNKKGQISKMTLYGKSDRESKGADE